MNPILRHLLDKTEFRKLERNIDRSKKSEIETLRKKIREEERERVKQRDRDREIERERGGEILNQIQYFSHKHPLELWSCRSGTCWICWQRLPAGPMYTCTLPNCLPEFSIHKSCAEFPREMVHPFHPQHSLTLLHISPYESGGFKCSACGKNPWGFIFHCPKCEFDLDPPCASLIPTNTITRKGEKTHHLGHPHPLILCHSEMQFVHFCSGCKLPVKKGSPIYVCLECNHLLDETCAEWPQQIQHPFHPQHPLTLLFQRPHSDSTRSRCSVCGKVLEGFSFHCYDCGFSLDARCASLIPAQNSDYRELQQIEHHQFSHPHPLIKCEKRKELASPLTCDACQDNFNNESVYICLDCRFLLHKSCADLPREVERSFYHQQHKLYLHEYSPRQAAEPFEIMELLRSKTHFNNPTHDKSRHELDKHEKSLRKSIKKAHLLFKGEFRCKARNVHSSGFAYACTECKFCIATTWLASKPHIIKSELHQHPLAFFHMKSDGLHCEACARLLHTPFFRCVDCDFNLHIQCVPTLPLTAKSKFHRHPLTLTHSPIKDRLDEDEKAEFYCDHCEKPRELEDHTYYCEECHFVAHVHCLASEILCILEEEWSSDCKLGETKLDMSASVCQENPSTGVSKGVIIEEIREQEGAELESRAADADADDVDRMASSSSKEDFSGFPTDNEITARGVSSEVDSLLVELDEEIAVIRRKVESLATELKATEKRLKELKERRVQHVTSGLASLSGE